MFYFNFVLASAVVFACLGLLVSLVLKGFKQIAIALGGGQGTSIYWIEKGAIRGLILGTMLGGLVVLALQFEPSILNEINAGTIRVLDGDTIKVGKTRMQLKTLDAVEVEDAKCAVEREVGIAAKAYLEGLVRGSFTYIHHTGSNDRFGRPLVVLFVNGKNANHLMARAGYVSVGERFRAVECTEEEIIDFQKAIWPNNPPSKGIDTVSE
jgi:endonuclease YncB( thermonuclease family)